MSEKLKKIVFEKNWYNALLQNGNEKFLLANYIKDLLLKHKARKMLEVGMGVAPIFANVLSEKVQDYVILEKEEITDVAIPKNTRLITGDFELVRFTEKFDVILLCHVIYYFLELEKAIVKTLNLLEEGGIAIFVVNGPNSDYGRLKRAVAEIARFQSKASTYHRLKGILKNADYVEYMLESVIYFSNYEDLYNNVRIFFDLYQSEFDANKQKIIRWLKNNVKNNAFRIDQKILVVRKSTHDIEKKME